MPFSSLDKLIGESLGKKPALMKQVRSAMALEEFDKAVRGLFREDIAVMMKPLYIRDGVLTVACLSSACASELKFKERKIIAAINAALGRELVTRIRTMT